MATPTASGRNTAPNPKDFKFYEDAFAYPVPVVRRFETQLQSTLNETKSRLRSLVGDSYRELLGSADKIIDMHAETKRLDSAMDLIATKCSGRAVDKAMTAHRMYAQKDRQTRLASRRLAADLTLSQACITASRTAQSTQESPLLVAKLLTLARLLLQSAGTPTNNTPAPRPVQNGDLPRQHPPIVLDSLWRKHRQQSRSLLASIDGRIQAVGHIDKARLLDALAAHALVTTSTTTDVLRHYLHVRQSVLSSALEIISSTKANAQHGSTEHPNVDCLVILFQTLDHAQTIFPKRLAEALARHRDRPVIQDAALRSAIATHLDLCEAWVSDNVKVYAHWIRHDDLTSTQVNVQLGEWAATALKSVLSGLNAQLEMIKEPETIVRLRKDMLAQWLRCSRSLPGVDIAECVSQTRSAFINRLQHIVETKAKSVEDLLQHHIATNEQTEVPQTPSLWDSAMHAISTQNGAALFRYQVDVRRQGKDSTVQSLTRTLDAWRHGLADLSLLIQTMRETRWNDVVDLDGPADADDTASIILPLSREDPDALDTYLKEKQETTLKASMQHLGKAIADDEIAQNTGLRAIQLLRITRQFLRCTSLNVSASPRAKEFQGLQILYPRIAQYVTGQATMYLDASDTSSSAQSVLSCDPVTELWSGEPPLPRNPSTACIRFAYEIQKAMQVHGSDIWTASAVDALKSRLSSRVHTDARLLLQGFATKGEALDETNGTKDATAEPDDKSSVDEVNSKQKSLSDMERPMVNEDNNQQRATQATFDAVYLRTLLRLSPRAESSGTEEWEDIVSMALGRSGLIDGQQTNDQVCARIDKSVAEYHRRTYLLFGLLSPPV